ncbi:MAG TPA: NADH-quinone oxidoreductase subunit K [Bosea sp. (in: a-proteobacteria)]|jgi:multicomponent Na+:H+ antiporter subunit C|uniref:NADH-quinone oxidoreductase subunit K n=1 Tax=Bosea sp. (in: a-proteobacteria) TaxID=1871050 RepID=UPI002E114816|nr:NADH-quinone oxidoreductase subunit K [Bosea sp. (in: a-proteobacteria)]
MSAIALTSASLFGLCGSALVGIGLFCVIAHPELLRRLVGFNILGAGIFLVFGAVSRRGAAMGLGGDPVPQAMVITGVVVAFAATALAIALLRRLASLTGTATLDPTSPEPSETAARSEA